MKSILVTGGAGFIGVNLVRKLLAEGHRVMNVDCLSYAANKDSMNDFFANQNHEFLEADITDESAMTAAFTRFCPDWVFHLAAETHVDRSISDSSDFLRTNVQGTGVVLGAGLAHWKSLDASRRSDFRFIHVSTDEVFGSLGAEGSFSESSAYAPRSPYSASKAASDHLVRAWGITYGLPVIVTNCSNNYGPFQFPEKLIPLVIVNGCMGRKIPVYGKGLQIRDWIHVSDHCEALALVAERGISGETYVIGGGREMRNIDLVRELCAILKDEAGVEPVIEFVSDRPGHDFRYSLDTSKIRRELGWEPRRDFQQGLRGTVRWYLENRGWWEKAPAPGKACVCAR